MHESGILGQLFYAFSNEVGEIFSAFCVASLDTLPAAAAASRTYFRTCSLVQLGSHSLYLSLYFPLDLLGMPLFNFLFSRSASLSLTLSIYLYHASFYVEHARFMYTPWPALSL